MRPSGFTICHNKGFHVTFENGWTVSVQFGGENYCDNYDFLSGTERNGSGMASPDAEVAYFPSDAELQQFPEGDTVLGWQTPAQVLALMNRVAAMEPK